MCAALKVTRIFSAARRDPIADRQRCTFPDGDSCRIESPGRMSFIITSQGKVGSLSAISGALGRWTVHCWDVTSAERMGGAFEERFLRFSRAGAPLSKSAISRIVGRLQSLFSQWRKRSLKGESVVFLYLDAIALRVRIANKVVWRRCRRQWE